MALSMAWNRLGFRAKLICVGVLLQVLMLAAVAVGVTTLVDRYLQRELTARVGQLKPLFNSALAAPLAQRDFATVAAILTEARATRDLVFVCVRDASGRMIAESRADSTAFTTGASGLTKPAAVEAAQDSLDFEAPLEMGGQVLGQVEFGLSRSALAQTRQSLLWALALIGVLCLLVFSALLAALSHALTRPLSALAEAARDIHAANYDVSFDPDRKDELGVLMKAFARMGLEMRRKVAELLHSEALQRKYLQEAIRRQTETSLALQAAETANAAKADFIANMSHEVRTPMNAIVGYADMLLRTPLQAEQQAYVQRLQNASTALLGVMNNVLDFSKIEAGQLQPSTEPFDVIATLDSVMSLFQPQLRGGAVRLRLDMAPDVPRLISADGLRLHQVLVNLVGNAVKFTETGRVTVRACWAQPGVLRFEVEDTGIGIPEAAQARLFERFSQADASTTRRFGGSGLGLAITRRLAELMQGEVGFWSREGEGSRFWLEVRAEPVAADDRPEQVSGAMLEGVRALVVEDNATNRMIATKLLEQLGAQVSTAVDGYAGVEAAAEGGFDLILMDIQMPGIDGVEAARRIRAMGGDVAATPIVALTANVLAHQRQAYLDAGMDGVVGKPISPGELLTEIAQAAQRRHDSLVCESAAA
jgi:signal transduction histidine kinase/CheY-like chemotaxis protein